MEYITEFIAMSQETYNIGQYIFFALLFLLAVLLFTLLVRVLYNRVRRTRRGASRSDDQRSGRLASTEEVRMYAIGQRVIAPSMGNIGGHVVATLTAAGAKGLTGSWHSGRKRQAWGKGPVYLVQFDQKPYRVADAGKERSSNRVLLPEAALKKVVV